MPRLLSALVLSLCSSPYLTAEQPSAQWIVVTASAFRDAIEPLCELRKAAGLRVVVVQTTDVLSDKEIRAGDARKLREHVNKTCRDYKGTSYVLLVGAVEAGMLDDAHLKVLPALTGTISRMKGQPSDNGYGCLDDDRLPAIAVGRFPVRTEQEAKAMVRKTLDFERDRLPGSWRRRLTIFAGIPAYNPFVDKLVENLAMARFDRIDPSWTGRAIYHNPQSRFCVPDNQLQKQALQYVQEGQAFTLYLGHSSPEGFYGGAAHFLDRDDWAQLKITRGGVFATFGCNGCQLRGDDGEGYGLTAARNPNGPVAVFGSHGICFASMVQLAADGLFESTFTGKVPERLGESWLALKSGLAKGKIDDVSYKMLDAVDGDAKIPQATQRQEHLEMFGLLGDPALRLPVVPTDVRLTTVEKVTAGGMLKVQGEAPARLAGAKVILSLERTAGSVPTDLEPIPKTADDPFGKRKNQVMLANHERANCFVLTTAECEVRDGRFEVMMEVPAKLPWKRLLLRAYVATEKAEGMAVHSLTVTPQP